MTVLPGSDGGTAIKSNPVCTVTNYGVISGGGGGGGGGGLFTKDRIIGGGGSGGGGAPLGWAPPNPSTYDNYLVDDRYAVKLLMPPLNNPVRNKTYDLYCEVSIRLPTTALILGSISVRRFRSNKIPVSSSPPP